MKKTSTRKGSKTPRIMKSEYRFDYGKASRRLPRARVRRRAKQRLAIRPSTFDGYILLGEAACLDQSTGGSLVDPPKTTGRAGPAWIALCCEGVFGVGGFGPYTGFIV